MENRSRSLDSDLASMINAADIWANHSESPSISNDQVPLSSQPPPRRRTIHEFMRRLIKEITDSLMERLGIDGDAEILPEDIFAWEEKKASKQSTPESHKLPNFYKSKRGSPICMLEIQDNSIHTARSPTAKSTISIDRSGPSLASAQRRPSLQTPKAPQSAYRHFGLRNNNGTPAGSVQFHRENRLDRMTPAPTPNETPLENRASRLRRQMAAKKLSPSQSRPGMESLESPDHL